MVENTTESQPVAPVIVARSASVVPAPERRAAAPLTGRPAAGREGADRVAGARDGVRAAAGVMGWILWILLVLVTAAFLALAPRLISDARAQTVIATVPSEPQNLIAARGDGQVTLTWEAPADDGGGEIERYEHRHAKGASVPAGTAWASAGLALTATVESLANGTAYAFEVRAVNGAGEGPAAGASATPATVPGPPRNLETAPGDSEMSLQWEAPADDGGADIASYEFSYHEVGNEEDAETDFSASRTVTITGLENGTDYVFAVRAQNTAGDGAWAAVTARVAALPGEPRKLTATPGDRRMTLEWEAPASDGGAPIVRYDYSYGEPGSGDPARVTGDASLSVTIDGLTNGTEYNFLVWAVNGTGAGSWAALRARPAALPGAPRNLRATSGDSFLVIDWDEPASTGGVAIAGYRYRHVAGSSVPDETAWTDVTTKPLTFNGLTNGTKYAFELHALNSAGEGPAASIAATPGRAPGAPRNLSVTPGNGAVRLVWKAPADDGGAAITGYDYRYAAVSVPAEAAWTSIGDVLTVTVGDLTNGTDYAFQVRAVNGAGSGDLWAHASATPDADPAVTAHPAQASYRFEEGASDAAVAIVARTAPGARRPSVAFSVSVVSEAVPGGATSPEDYAALSEEIAVQPSDFAAAGGAWQATKSVALAMVEDDVTEGDEAFQVRLQPSPGLPAWLQLREADGTTACGSGGCLMTVTIAANGPPTAPRNLIAVSGDGGVLIDWDAPANSGGAPITGYEYRYAEGASVPDSTAWTDAGDVLFARVGNLTNGTAYTFEVRAVSEVGKGVAAAITKTPETIPAAPRNLTATPGDGRITFAWEAPADDGGSAVIRYEYRFAEDIPLLDETDWVSTGTALTVTLENLTNGTRYFFLLRAVNGIGGGAAIIVDASPEAVERVPQLPALSVADAEAREGVDSTVDFAVALSRQSTETVRVDYATADGSAKAGEDYTRTAGTLVFAAGETEKTLAVQLLDDAKDEGEETMTLTLSNARGARIADARATGTIANDDDAMPGAWLVRFGRTVAGQVVDAVSGRLDGSPGSHVIVAGIPVEHGAMPLPPDRPFDRAARAPLVPDETALTPGPTVRDVMQGSSFLLSAREAGDGLALSAWGRVATGGFEAEVDRVRIDGDVTTGFVAADADWGDLLTGVAVASSEGRGSFALNGSTASNRARGTVESTLTGVYPYARLRPDDRLSIWGLAGVASGDLTLAEEGGAPIRTDTRASLVALGAQGTLVPASEADGIELVLKSDGFWVRTTSDAVRSDATGNLESSAGEATRVRLALQGERVFALGEGETLAPQVEVGVRHDGGDAETGAGLELGAGVRYRAPGVTVEGAVRSLVAHEAGGYEGWSASGAIRVDPGAPGRGLLLTVVPAIGAPAGGSDDLWSRGTPQGLLPAGAFERQSRLDGELGYGVRALAGHGVMTPYVGLSLADEGARTLHAGTRWSVMSNVTFGLEASRDERAGTRPGHALLIRAAARW